jgi:hypothetical protein
VASHRRHTRVRKFLAIRITPAAVAAFGEVGASLADAVHAAGDVALDLSRGKPGFYILRVDQRGLVPLAFAA